MRLLLDNNLSPRLVDALAPSGWDVVHVRSLHLHAASDPVVLRAALDDGRVLVSADTDFGTLLAASRATGPSVVLVRRVAGRRVEQLAGILLANLPQVEGELRDGCIVVVGDDSLRVRPLPIG
ncbi:DUF5615 family PIN-like protein [Pseudonocardia saturnea]